MRRPAPASLADLKHPGPKAHDRRPHALCRADPVSIELAAGISLVQWLGDWADSNGFSSAVFDLGDLSLETFEYLMPDRPIDDRHAAWYSDTKSSAGARLNEAVAILGRKDGAWFAHIHAWWHEDSSGALGHLLPQTLCTSAASTITGWGLSGAAFEAHADPETEFTLFRVVQLPEAANRPDCNALIATLAPFEDLASSIRILADRFGDKRVEIAGLGSLAGAGFSDAEPMTALISEILIRPGAELTAEGDLSLPIRAVDLEGTLHAGTLVPGAGPTLITCELLLRITDG